MPNNRFHHDNPACHDSCGLVNERKNHARLGLQVKRMFGGRASRARGYYLAKLMYLILEA